MIKFLIALLFLLNIGNTFADGIVGWGENKSGQIATNKFDEKIIDFDVGPNSSCIVLESGKLICQGCANPLLDYGQCNTEKIPDGWKLELGGMRTTNEKMSNVSTSFGHACGINKNGGVECWGCGRPRQGFQCKIPEGVEKQKALISKNPLDGLRTVDVSETHSCVVMEDGSVNCWGCEDPENYGQCKSKSKIGALGVSATFRNTCAVLKDGTVSCWGSNEENQRKVPKGLSGVVSISGGYGYMAAVNSAGDLVIWGDAAPNVCSNELLCKDVKQVSASDDYLCIRKNDNQVFCFRTKNKVNFSNGKKLKDRKMYSWISDAKVKGLSTDYETNMVIVDNSIVDILEKRKIELPKQIKKMDKFEYLKSRKVMPPSEVFSNNKAKYDFENMIGMKFKSIPKGSFKMGGCGNYLSCLFTGYSVDSYLLESEKPLHDVTISKSIQVGIFEVTIGEFKRFIKENKIITDNKDEGKDHRFGSLIKIGTEIEYSSDYYPLTMVSWYEAKQFVEWLNKIKPKDDKGIYRLPTEAEWEYFARAGTKTIFWNGNDITNKNLANCKGCIDLEEPGPMPVGSFSPNPFGLYDIHGNVDEWVEDCIDVLGYKNAPKDGSAYKEGNCQYRGARGGSWEYLPEVVRSAWRDWYEPKEKTWEQGFRVVRELP